MGLKDLPGSREIVRCRTVVIWCPVQARHNFLHFSVPTTTKMVRFLRSGRVSRRWASVAATPRSWPQAQRERPDQPVGAQVQEAFSCQFYFGSAVEREEIILLAADLERKRAGRGIS